MGQQSTNLATTGRCYVGCQLKLILCYLNYNEEEQNPWVSGPVYSTGTISCVSSTFASMGGSVMQLLGVVSERYS